jgi:hypothetical protein
VISEGSAGAPVAAHSAGNRSFASRKGVLDLPLPLDVPDLAGPVSFLRPVGSVGPVEPALHTRCGHDPGGRRRRARGGETKARQFEQLAGHAFIDRHTLRRNQLEDAGGNQSRGGQHQPGDPGRPHLVDHGRVGAGAPGRRPSVLQPDAEGARVIPDLPSDLFDAEALALHRHDVRELLLGHHFRGPFSGLGAVDAQDPGWALD